MSSQKNSYQHYENYLGAGAYEHHIPALVDAIFSRSEFLTVYTPYQAEISQGMLQAIFEYQTAMCALTGMDFSNASLYDGASACAEALLMAMRLRKERSEILISSALHPNLDKGIKALDIAKRLLDLGFHSPTIYFPLIIKECMLIEPTESEPKETLDQFVKAMETIAMEINTTPELVKTAPHTLPVTRLDEVRATKKALE